VIVTQSPDLGEVLLHEHALLLALVVRLQLVADGGHELAHADEDFFFGGLEQLGWVGGWGGVGGGGVGGGGWGVRGRREGRGM
jgi:hypothetical protein